MSDSRQQQRASLRKEIAKQVNAKRSGASRRTRRKIVRDTARNLYRQAIQGLRE